MNKSSEQKLSLESIIGLGESSFRKNYYPALQKKLSDLEKLYNRNRTLIATIPDVLLMVDLNDNISCLSPYAFEREKLADAIINDNDIVDRFKDSINRARLCGSMVTYNFELEHDESHYYFEARINITTTKEALIIIRDMSERTMMEMQLRELAEKDSLTKLYNRHFFVDKLAKCESKYKKCFSLIFLDIDGLKIVNDALGHLSGDMLIAAFSNIIDSVFSDCGCVSRLGGDEFGVILDGYSSDRVELMLVNMNKKIAQFNAETEGLKLSVSSGYSYIEKGYINIDRLYRDADNKMYQNKLLKEASAKSGLVKSLMKAMEAKDFITEGHAERLEVLAVKIGSIINLSQNQMDRLKLLARFHDIGKVGIPDSILLKPAQLTADEWDVMKTHSHIGKRIAEASNDLKDISELILLHHERWDGKGYPFGIRGSSIPIECRIISIVDAFDAMTNDRPYRKALSMVEALEIISDAAGSQFDAGLVEIFFSAFTTNSHSLELYN